MPNEELVATIADALVKAMNTKAPSTVSTATMLTQPGGIFSVIGQEPDIISAHVPPQGIGAILPAIPSNTDDPRYGFITGFTDTIGTEQVYPCDDAPKGYMKAGTLTARFGRIVRETQTIEISSTLHEKRGVNTDLRLIGEMFGMTGMDMSNLSTAQMLNMVVQSEMVGVGVQFQRKLSQMMWQGAITNNTAGGGYKEFPGLDSQIATGLVDADTNQAMPAADSDIKDFNFSLVDGTTKDIVEYLSMMEYYLYHNAERMGLLPVTWAVVLRPELWQELSAVWPCRYLTHRCQTDTGANPVVINDNVNVNMRDAMRNGKYIDINGRRYPVVTDDGIYEYTNVNNANVPAGSYASSIYFVPLRIRGNFASTYWEYIDYRQVQAQLAALGPGRSNVPFWTTEGRFLWVYRDQSYCFDLQALIEPRVVLRTPHLAGKLQNVLYTPLQHLRSPYPDNAYFADGGLSVRGQATQNYASWGSFLS